MTEGLASSSPSSVEGEVRETVVNWLNLVLQIVDGYKAQGRGIAHGVQKDAVQNSWDARIDRKLGRGWKMRFDLTSGPKGEFFSFTDEGTCGLTGRVLRPEEMEEDLPEEERWGRFESLAFTKSAQGSIVPLGSRGRGKFIFVGASKDYSIFYDTIRSDGSYRLGTRTVRKTSSPIRAWNNGQARQELDLISGRLLKSLTSPGTRIVVQSPIGEVVETMRSGEFARYIGETWWEIISRFDAKIIVSVGDKETIVEVPKEFELPDRDSDQAKTWIQENVKLAAGKDEYLVKRLHIVSKRAGVPEDIRGVAIQRGGMKVCSVEARYMPQDLADSIYGYVTLDREAERQLLIDESPEHYGFDFRFGLPKAIRHYIEEEIGRFARAKLGWRTDTRQIRREKQRGAERMALLEINRIAKDLGFGKGIGPGKKPRKKAKRPWKKIRIQLSDVTLPREGDLRINYGEVIRNISARVINDTRFDVAVRLKLFVRQGDNVSESFVDHDVNVNPRDKSKYFGPFDAKFTPEKYPIKGKVTLVARIISLMEANKGETLDEERMSFYLEEDPPPRGLFEDCIPTEWPIDEPDIGHLMGDDQPGERQGVIVHYNTLHPAYVAVEDSEDDAAAYLFRLMGLILCKLDLQSDHSILFGEEERDEPEDVARATLRLMSDFDFRFYKSRMRDAGHNS